MAGPANGIDAGWIAPDGTAGTPLDAAPDAAWIDLGRFYTSDDLGPEPNATDDTMGRPVTTSYGMDASLEVVDGERYSSVEDLEGARVVFAALMPDQTFRIVRKVRAYFRPMPGAGTGNQTFRIQLKGAAVGSRDLLSDNTAAA